MTIIFGTIQANQQVLSDCLTTASSMGDFLDGSIGMDHPDVVRVLGNLDDDDYDYAVAQAKAWVTQSIVDAAVARLRIRRMNMRQRP